MQTFRFKADEEKLSAGANRTPTAFVYDTDREREREREGERRKRSSANDICNDLSPPSRASRREPFEQPHTSVTYFFFSLFLLFFFFFLSFPLSFFRGNGIFKSLVGGKLAVAEAEVLLDLLASFTARFFSPSNYTHTHTVA